MKLAGRVRGSLKARPPAGTFSRILAIWSLALTVIYVNDVLGIPEILAVVRTQPLLPIVATMVTGAILGLAFWYVESRWSRSASLVMLGTVVILGGVYMAFAAGVPMPLASALLIFASAFGYGSILTRGVLDAPYQGWAGIPLQTALGLALLIAIATVLAAMRLLVSPAIWIMVLLGLALLVVSGWPRPRPERSSSSRADVAVVWWWFVALVLLVGLVRAVAPETGFDALTAHLPIAREFLRRGGFVVMRQNIVSYWQLNGALLYAVGMGLFADTSVGRFMHYGAGVLACLLVYAVGARTWHPRVGLIAATVVAGTPLFLSVGGTAYTDLWVVLFTTAALSLVPQFIRRPDFRTSVLAGMLCGAALGVKPPALIIVLPFSVWLVMWVRRSSLDTKGRAITHLAFAAGMILTGATWYLRAWILTGNPIFPLLNNVFKSPLWPQVSGLGLGFGTGTRPLDLILLPWRLTRHPSLFVETSDLGVTYLVLLPPIIVAIARRSAPGWAWSTLAIASLMWAFVAAQYLRYLLPALPLAALIGTGEVLTGHPGRSTAIGTLALLVAVGVGVVGFVVSGPPQFPIVAVLDRTVPEAYLETFLPSYRSAEFVRQSLPSTVRLYSIGEPQVFYYDRYVVPAGAYGRAFRPIVEGKVLDAQTGREVRAVLLEAGFTHLLLNRNNRIIMARSRLNAWIRREAPWTDARLVYASSEFYLFALADESVTRAGRALFVDHAKLRGEARGPGSLIIRRVHVEPLRLYGLHAVLRAPVAPAQVRIALAWLSGEDLLPGPTIRDVTVEGPQNTYALASTAPQGADTAILSITVLSGTASLDGVQFEELE